MNRRNALFQYLNRTSIYKLLGLFRQKNANNLSKWIERYSTHRTSLDWAHAFHVRGTSVLSKCCRWYAPSLTMSAILYGPSHLRSSLPIECNTWNAWNGSSSGGMTNECLVIGWLRLTIHSEVIRKRSNTQHSSSNLHLFLFVFGHKFFGLLPWWYKFRHCF